MVVLIGEELPTRESLSAEIAKLVAIREKGEHPYMIMCQAEFIRVMAHHLWKRDMRKAK